MTTVVRANKILLQHVHEAAALHPIIGSTIVTDADAINAALLHYAGVLRDAAGGIERRREISATLRAIADEIS